ncbi:unnamed protein product [Haemonchus placei]|uniref:Branched-chain amino acid ABC transporter permease n=1 Tax=Haemonchus placei TaxID=6290 RepID=A0A0N4WWR6_HAEPC|nr:unnamed protein product [Haemonchus placei]
MAVIWGPESIIVIMVGFFLRIFPTVRKKLHDGFCASWRESETGNETHDIVVKGSNTDEKVARFAIV